jgi:hypothetical protein
MLPLIVPITALLLGTSLLLLGSGLLNTLLAIRGVFLLGLPCHDASAIFKSC